jgi:hypothetical protein
VKVRPAASAFVLLLFGLAACDPENAVGYIEIKALPPLTSVPLYLDAVKLEPFRNGNAVLRQKVGTSKLQTDADGGLSLLCNIEVKKNRITSVTVSAERRQTRCQCGRAGPADAAANRTCIG